MHTVSSNYEAIILTLNKIFSVTNYYRRPMAQGRPLYFHPVVSILFYLSIFLFFFFVAWSQQPQTGCLPYFNTWCGPSANLECRSETCCARHAENAGPKTSPKISHLGTIAQLCWAISSQVRHVSTIRKKTC